MCMCWYAHSFLLRWEEKKLSLNRQIKKLSYNERSHFYNECGDLN